MGSGDDMAGDPVFVTVDEKGVVAKSTYQGVT